MHIYANTHDPNNNTRYYKWAFTETWKYNSRYRSGILPDSLWTCYEIVHSGDIFIGTSAKLTEDIIYKFPLVFIPEGAQALGIM